MKKMSATSSTMALFLWSVIAQAAPESQANEILSGAPSPGVSISLWSCVVLAIVVFGVIIYSVAAFHASTAHARDKTRELVWALVPIAIVVAAAAPAMKSFAPRLKSGATSMIAKTETGNSAVHCVTLPTSSIRATVVRASSPVPCSTPR